MATYDYRIIDSPIHNYRYVVQRREWRGDDRTGEWSDWYEPAPPNNRHPTIQAAEAWAARHAQGDKVVKHLGVWEDGAQKNT